jgi:hypothetical protein
MNNAKKPICFDLFSDTDHSKGFLFSSQKACLPDEITKLQKNAITRLNSGLPDGYIDFLRRINGYCDERIIIFASNRIYSKKRNKIHYIEGVIEANQSYYGQFPREILLGQCGENWLAYDSERQLYLSFSEASLAREEAAGFLTFNHCVKYALMELQTNVNHLKSEAMS